jgi:mannose-6-phosphate isomerase-like protein (cupin superfamily)
MAVGQITSPEFRGYGEPVEIPAGALDSEGTAALWAAEVFASRYGVPKSDVKTAVLEYAPSREYTALEVHKESPQLFVALVGRMAVPVAPACSRQGLCFFELDRGQAAVVFPSIWHAKPIALDPSGATFLYALAAGTSERDTLKEKLPESFTITEDDWRR